LCDEIALAGKMNKLVTLSGTEMARLCLANGTPAMLVPGGPPGLEVEIRIEEFAKHGVEWIVTGDVFEDKFELFREQFNKVMREELTRRHGADGFARIEAKVQSRIKALER
jgi:hypothetical protein